MDYSKGFEYFVTGALLIIMIAALYFAVISVPMVVILACLAFAILSVIIGFGFHKLVDSLVK